MRIDGVARQGSDTHNVSEPLRCAQGDSRAFSKKLENHALSVALHYMNYNFCCIHKTVRVTPAMAAGVTDRLWSIGDMLKVLEHWENTT